MDKNLKVKIISLILGMLSMGLGVAIYLFARPTEAVAIEYALEVIPFLDILRSETIKYNYPYWLLYNLPDFLWSYSYSIIILGLWFDSRRHEYLFWISTIPILTIGYEVSQYWEFVPGVFDLTDLMFIISGILLSFLTMKILKGVSLLNKKKGFIAASALLMAFGMALGSSESDIAQPSKVDKQAQTEASTGAEQSKETTQKAKAETFKIGDSVKLGDLELTVNSARVVKGSQFSEAKEGNKFVAIDVTVVNDGDEPEHISSLMMFKLYGEDSYQKEDSIFVETKGNVNGELAPGRSMRGELAYEVGENETNWELVFESEIFQKGQAIIEVELN